MHVTKFEREKDSFPLPFAVKLRKHIKNRRCTAVRQLGLDRVVDLTFGVGDKAHHLIFEFYASGNMILTDHEFKILDLLRVHTYETKKEKKTSNVSEKTQKKHKKKKNRRKQRSKSSSSTQSNNTELSKSEDGTSVNVGRVYPLALAARNVTEILSSLKASKEEEEEETTSITNLNAKRLESAVRLCLCSDNRTSNESKTVEEKDHGEMKKIGLKWFLTSRLDCTKVFGPNLISHCIASSEISLRTTLELDEKNEKIQGLNMKDFETLSENLRTLPSLLVRSSVRRVREFQMILTILLHSNTGTDCPR